MNKDNLIFAAFGVLLGFFAGYFMKEVMDMRQPPRFAVGQGAPMGATGAPAVPGGGGSAGGAPVNPSAPGGGGGTGAPGGGAPMAEVQELQARLERNPDDAEAILRLAHLNFDIRRWDRARDLYERYLQLQPATPDTLSDLGVCYRETGEYDRALALFDQAQQMAPDHWQSRFNEVIVLAFDKKQFDRADEVLNELRSLQPNNPDIERLAAEVERRRNA